MAENGNAVVTDEVTSVENENAVATGEVTSVENDKPSFFSRVWSGLKERCRKFIVKLKRRPMNIAFFVLIISTIVNLCILGLLSQLGLSNEYSREYQGLCIFVNQLFGILVLMLFMNSFPKREKKPKVVMLILCFVFMAILIGLDIYLYIIWGVNYEADLVRTQNLASGAYKTYWYADKVGIMNFYPGARSGLLAHLILVGIAMILTATYPLYGKLINKINTKKVVESTELKEEIDTSAEV